MADVRTRETLASGTTTALVEWSRVGSEARVPEIETPLPRERRTRPRRSSRQDAVEHVDPARDDLEDSDRVADPHEVPREFGRKERCRPLDAVEHLLLLLTHREAAEREAVERKRADLVE